MGHYDSSRPEYCTKCGAAPGNLVPDGICPFCHPARKEAKARRRMVNQAGKPIFEYAVITDDMTETDVRATLGLLLEHLGLRVVTTNATKSGCTEYGLRRTQTGD